MKRALRGWCLPLFISWLVVSVWGEASAQLAPQVSTLAGTGQSGRRDGPVESATFSLPVNVAVGPNGVIFIADLSNRSIRTLGPDRVVRTLPVLNLVQPTGLAPDSRGGLYVSDQAQHRIFYIGPDGTSTVVAGAGRGDSDGPAQNARFNRPSGLLLLADGTLLIADAENGKIRALTPQGRVVTLLGGPEKGNGDGPPSVARFVRPVALALGPNGVILIADSGASSLRVYNPGNQPAIVGGISVPAGEVATLIPPGGVDRPASVVADAEGRIFLTEPFKDQVRMISVDGKLLLLAGGQRGFQDGPGRTARFVSPSGLALDNQGRLIVADVGNRRIRSILRTGIRYQVAPTGVVEIPVGKSQRFVALSAFVLPTLQEWAVAGGPVRGTVTRTGVYTAPALVPVPEIVALVTRPSTEPTADAVIFLKVTRTQDPNVQEPRITSFSPLEGPPGQQVVIRGENLFDPAGTVVGFGGVLAQEILSIEATQIVVRVPVGARTGPVSVTTAGGIALSDQSFNVTPPPIISSFTPQRGFAGTQVTIEGENFTPNAVVSLGLLPAQVLSITEKRIIVMVPERAVTSPWSVRTPGGTTLSTTLFEVPPAPALRDFNPKAGFPGTLVTLQGGPFNEANPGSNQVFFGGALATLLQVKEDQIIAQVPDQARTGPITVITPSGTASSAIAFTVNPPPVLLQVDPPSAPVGKPITLRGQNFNTVALGSNIVTFSGNVRGIVGAVTADTIVVTVPVGALTGPITVTTPGGSAVSPQPFGVIPVITDFSPRSAPVGSFITIEGAGFDYTAPQNNVVTFGGVISNTVQLATPTEIIAEVPPGVPLGPIEVITAGGKGVSSQTFVPGAGAPIGLAKPTPFQVVPPTPSANVVAGDEVTFPFLVVGGLGFTNLVNVAIDSLPAGLTAKLSANQVAPGRSFDLVLQVPRSQSAGRLDISLSFSTRFKGEIFTQAVRATINVIPLNVTTLSGRILTAEDIPAPVGGAEITLAGKKTTSDFGGNFVLVDVPAGTQTVEIDGRPASTDRFSFPKITVPVTLTPGQANRVPFTFFLPKQPPKTSRVITETDRFIVEDKRIAHLSLQIDKQVAIVLPDGTSLPTDRLDEVGADVTTVDRAPKPLPSGVTAKAIFSFKPSGAIPKLNGSVAPVPVIFPNILGLKPGTQVNLWYLDPSTGEWSKTDDKTDPRNPKDIIGVVSEDGLSIRFGPGFGPASTESFKAFSVVGDFRGKGLPVLTSAFPAPLPGVSQEPPSPTSGSVSEGDPVDVASGVFYFSKTDLRVPGPLSLTVTRTYRQLFFGEGPFGIGTSLGFDVRVEEVGPSALSLVLPGEVKYSYSFDPDLGAYKNVTTPFLLGSLLFKNPTGLILRFVDGTVYRFNPLGPTGGAGKLIEITDRANNQILLERDQTGKITRIRDNAGRFISLTYDGAGRILQATDHTGRTVQYSYNSVGFLETVTDTLGGVTRYTYDERGLLSSITDPRGITFIRNTYYRAEDFPNDPLKGQVLDGRIRTQTFADGGVNLFEYETQGSFIVATRFTDSLGNTRTYRFNPAGFIISVENPLGQVVRYERDLVTNLVLAIEDPLGRRTTYEYDTSGNIVKITDPAGNVVSATYKTLTLPEGVQQVSNLPEEITDPLGNVTRFSYNDQGLITQITDAEGNSRRFEYQIMDTVIRLIRSIDPEGGVTTYSYDSAGNITGITDPVGNTQQFVYDALSRVVQIVDPLGNITQFAYNQAHLLTQVTDAEGQVTTFEYNPNGLRTKITRPGGAVTQFRYDNMDRLSEVIDPLGNSERFEYDTNGNLIAFTDRRGLRTVFAYDRANRRIRQQYADGSVVSFTYDAVGRIETIQDSLSGTISYTYDALNRVIEEASPTGRVRYDYDPLGRKTVVQILEPGNVTPIQYQYDRVGRQTRVLFGNLSIQLAYDKVGRRTRIIFPNGVVQETSYDPAGRILAISYKLAGSELLPTISYTYDSAGNVLSREGGDFLPESPLVGNYEVNLADRITRVEDTFFEYDANGNLVKITGPEGVTQLTWDARNRLVSINGPGFSASYLYDGLNRRIRKVINFQTIDYLYDGNNILAEVSPTSVNAVYLRGASLDDFLARIEVGGRLHFYLTDALKSVIALTDATGQVVTRYLYDSFGNTDVIGQGNPNPFQFNGRENDGAGFYYYRARYLYTPLGRFISEDPTGFTLAEPNLYNYVNNNPTTFVDPTGLQIQIREVLLRGLTIFNIAQSVQQTPGTQTQATQAGAVSAPPAPQAPEPTVTTPQQPEQQAPTEKGRKG